MGTARAQIEGSAPTHPPAARRLESVSPETPVVASIILQRRSAENDIAKQLFSPNFQPLAREDAASQLGADPIDLGVVEAFVQQNGLSVQSADAVTRTVKVEGVAADIERAFGVRLSWYEGPDGQRYMSYDGPITVPEDVSQSIVAITGLDNRPIAHTREL